MGKIGRDTLSWRMFETLFLEIPQDKYPYTYDANMTFGEAINKAQMLNMCQVQWEQQQGIPKGVMTRSAKAKLKTPQHTSGGIDYSAPAILIISDSPRRTGRKPGNSKHEEMLRGIKELFAKPKQEISELPTHPAESSIEDKIQKWIGDSK
jgi:hypothetical protein